MSKKKDYTINYDALPVLAVGFTRSTNLISRLIQFIRKILNDDKKPNHVFLVTENRKQKYATEQTISGLQERSLEIYTYNDNKIISMYDWSNLLDKTWKEDALDYLAYIRRKNNDDSKYDFKGLVSFLPFFGKFFKADKNKEWCSENAAGILKKFGADFIDKKEIAPDELLKLMMNNKNCIEIKNYYLEN